MVEVKKIKTVGYVAYISKSLVRDGVAYEFDSLDKVTRFENIQQALHFPFDELTCSGNAEMVALMEEILAKQCAEF